MLQVCVVLLSLLSNELLSRMVGDAARVDPEDVCRHGLGCELARRAREK